MSNQVKLPDCPACDQLMAAISNEPDLSRVRDAYPAEMLKLVTELHYRNHEPGGRG